VTVSDPVTGSEVTDTVVVTVTGEPADVRPPTISAVSPKGRTKDRTPKVVAVVRDEGGIQKRGITVLVDGRQLRFAYDERRDRVTAVVRQRLRPGLHRVKVVAVDVAGNRAVRTWQFRVMR
jgi:uncharacterized OB-fold protein